MINGMYLSTMGALVQTGRHATIANNLANANTHGFKPDWSIFTAVPVENAWHPERRFQWDKILMRTGGGVWNDTTITNLREGPLQRTGNAFDIALANEVGSGMTSFMMISPDGAEPGEVYYTRAGHLTPDQNGVLRTTTGDRVLDPAGEPIVIPMEDGNPEVQIRDDGTILSRAEGGMESVAVGQIGVVRTADYRNMKKEGDSRFVSQGAEMLPWQNGVRSGYLEESATNAIDEMTGMIEASRIYETNMRFITIQDETLGQTVRRVGAPSTA